MNKLKIIDKKIINSMIENHDECMFISLKNLNSEKLDMLNKKYLDGLEMKEIKCLFNRIIINNIHKIKLNNIIHSIFKQNVITTQGNIYLSKIKNKQIIIKRSFKDNEEYNFELLKEYFIGIYLNNLRTIIPNFMFVFGIIDCNKINSKSQLHKICRNNNYNFLLLEKINGNTLKKHFISENITLKLYKNLLCQLLIALEIAQKEYKYCHYDLHFNNIILRKKKHNYKVNINNLTYNIDTEYILNIIDYGHSSIEIKYNNKKKFIGGRHYKHAGIYPFLIPGFDMYKFLCFSLLNCIQNKNESTISIIKYIKKIFIKFYKKKDPLNIFINNKLIEQNVYNFINNKHISSSNIMRYTPLSMLNFLYDNNMTNNIKVQNRIKFDIIAFNKYNIYNDKVQIEIEKMFDFIFSQKLLDSYIHRKYIKHISKLILKNGRKYMSEKKYWEINDKISNIEYNNDMLQYDISIISKIKILIYYMNICYDFFNEFKYLQNICLIDKNLSKIKIYNIFKNILNNYRYLKVYKYLNFKLKKNLNIIYTYLELRQIKKIKKIKCYEDFIKSSIYKNVNKTINHFEYNYRWFQTLLNYIFMLNENKLTRITSFDEIFKDLNLSLISLNTI